MFNLCLFMHVSCAYVINLLSLFSVFFGTRSSFIREHRLANLLQVTVSGVLSHASVERRLCQETVSSDNGKTRTFIAYSMKRSMISLKNPLLL